MTTLPVHAVNLICPNCHTWNLGTPAAGDKFCSWCGSSIFEMQLREKDQPVLADLNVVRAAPTSVSSPRPTPSKTIPRVRANLTFPDFAHESSTGAYELKTWALAGRERGLPVRLKNDGKQTLEVYAVEATPELEHLMRKSPALPVRLAPQETVTFHFMLDMRAVASAEINKGLVAFRFRTEEKGSEHTAQFALQVETRVPSPFNGMAALDFGASHSCLAVIDQKNGKETAGRLLEMHGETLVPTAVLYHRVEGEKERIYEIGRKAEAVQKNRLWLEDFKRALQHEQPLPVLPDQAPESFMLTSGAIASDYLRALLHAAEDRLAEETFARGQQSGKETDFSACVLQEILVACPSTFTFQQKQILRQALSEAGVNMKAESFQPAAAMACFSELKEIIALWESSSTNVPAEAALTRHVLVYDLGAAFTDMALVRLNLAAAAGNKLEPSAPSNIRAKILGGDGDDQFGGNNVTAALAKYLAQQFMAQLERKLHTRPQLPLWHHAGAAPVKKIEHIGLLNWKQLLHHAELVKQRLAAEPAPAQIAAQKITLQVVAGKKLQTASIDGLTVKAVFFEKVVAERLELHLRKMHKLLCAVGLETPDLIYLSGRSATLPAVRKTMSAAFACRIVFAGELASTSNTAAPANPSLENLKASVALGGVQYLQLLQSGGAFSK